jgi:hypothetical protein
LTLPKSAILNYFFSFFFNNNRVFYKIQGWKLKTKFAFTVKEPPKELVEKALKADEGNIEAALAVYFI